MYNDTCKWGELDNYNDDGDVFDGHLVVKYWDSFSSLVACVDIYVPSLSSWMRFVSVFYCLTSWNNVKLVFLLLRCSRCLTTTVFFLWIYQLTVTCFLHSTNIKLLRCNVHDPKRILNNHVKSTKEGWWWNFLFGRGWLITTLHDWLHWYCLMIVMTLPYKLLAVCCCMLMTNNP